MTLASHKLFPMTPIAELGAHNTDGFHDNLYKKYNLSKLHQFN